MWLGLVSKAHITITFSTRAGSYKYLLFRSGWSTQRSCHPIYEYMNPQSNFRAGAYVSNFDTSGVRPYFSGFPDVFKYIYYQYMKGHSVFAPEPTPSADACLTPQTLEVKRTTRSTKETHDILFMEQIMMGSKADDKVIPSNVIRAGSRFSRSL